MLCVIFKNTLKKLIAQIQQEPARSVLRKSRREWLLNRFEYAGKYNNKISNYKFWQDGNHAIEVFSENVTWQKINYIHQNPVVKINLFTKRRSICLVLQETITICQRYWI
jgi:hypothetical protein